VYSYAAIKLMFWNSFGLFTSCAGSGSVIATVNPIASVVTQMMKGTGWGANAIIVEHDVTTIEMVLASTRALPSFAG
jgi:hypothetical protein